MKSQHPPTLGRFRRSAVLTLASAVVTAGIVVAGAGAANAALVVTVINTDGAGVASRSAPTIASVNGYGTPANAVVTTVCWTWGDAVGPNSNRLWWLVTYAGRQFYVDDRYLSTPNIANQPPASEPQCGTVTAPPPAASTQSTKTTNAVAWAKTQIGHLTQPNGSRWSGYCETFVEMAYGTSKQYGSAAIAASKLGPLHPSSDTTPPAGALVFYASGTLGHVALSIGGGQAIGTYGSDPGTMKAVAQGAVNNRGLKYLGWAAAPTSWPGR